MTVAATRTYEFDIDGICRQAYRYAGLANPYTQLSTEQLGDAREKLELITKSAATEGLLEKVMDFETITLVNGDADYALSASVPDVVGKAGSGEDNTVLSPMTREELLVLQQDEDAEGPPNQYFVDYSTSPVTLHLWPTPGDNEAGHEVRLQVHRLRADSTAGADTADFEPYWQRWLVLQLAHDIALSGGRDASSCSYLQKRADDQLEKCKPQAKRRGPGRVTLSMPTNWSR